MTDDAAGPTTAARRSTFSWDVVDAGVRRTLAEKARIAGNDDSPMALAAAFGSPPRAEKFAAVAGHVRDAWLPIIETHLLLDLAAAADPTSTPVTREAAIGIVSNRRLTKPFVAALRTVFVGAHRVGPDGGRRSTLPDRIADWWEPRSGAITQLCVWMQENAGSNDGSDPVLEGQELYALSDTVHGERQVVWEGGGRRSIIAFVDFAGIPFKDENDVWSDWGAVTYLSPPLDEGALRLEPALHDRFFGAGRPGLQGRAKTITRAESEAFGRLIGDLPPSAPPTGTPDGQSGTWTGRRSIVPEATFENAIIETRSLWRDLGYTKRPQRQLVHSTGDATSDRHDLEGETRSGRLIVEVKRAVNLDAVDQIQRYLRNRRADAPEVGWTGALVQGDVGLSAPVRERLEAVAEDGDDIPVWSMVDHGGSFRLQRLR